MSNQNKREEKKTIQLYIPMLFIMLFIYKVVGSTRKVTKTILLPAQEENENLENITLVKDNEVLSQGEHAASSTCYFQC